MEYHLHNIKPNILLSIYFLHYVIDLPGCGVVSDGPGGGPPAVVDWPGCDCDGVGSVSVNMNP